MPLFNLFKNNQKSVKEIAGIQFDYPEQISFIGMPKDNEVFQSATNVMDITVIERAYKDTSYREVYVVDFNLVSELKNTDYKVKRMDVVKTEKGQLGIVLQSKNYSNSWIDSNLEAMEIASEQPIYVTRDKDAGVYEATAVDTLSIPITDEDIEDAFTQAFENYQIDSLEHPIIKEIMGGSLSGNVVDSLENDIGDDNDDSAQPYSLTPELTEEELDFGEEVGADDMGPLEWELYKDQAA
ncbi:MULTISPECIES: hypothetical protein [Vibrio]|uniref:Uncharacterized protein n=1 Tax=Vibrio mimicus TaxID=674 RepID=A0A2J9V0U1_VIBMI|nr:MULTISPECIES: hypothetical protein [Vibrio]EEW10392.1 hypothetical protein VMD_21290 [Vibrio mimicus VM573]EGR2404814.1 hypothetical protein [Vibrio cholerae]EGU17613.1 hypothetical protein SX4_2285 [Vibrio mimicus SX-4]EKF9856589.1 hypothetical protein [Vibrio cholerae]KFE29642.1 hypothetical protein DN31_3639 [Vibrio mimicus]